MQRLDGWVRACLSKTRYPSQSLADRAAKRCAADRGVPLRVYACPECGGWHLTKSAKNPAAHGDSTPVPAPPKLTRSALNREIARVAERIRLGTINREVGRLQIEAMRARRDAIGARTEPEAEEAAEDSP